MPTEAQLARINTVSDVGKVANATALLKEQLREVQGRQVQALCCNLFNSANIAIASGGWTALQFNTETYDQYGMHSTVTNTSRITCVVPGKYVVDAGAEWASSVAHASGAGIRFLLNGATVIKRFEFYSCDIRVMTISGLVHFTAADEYLEVQVIQNTGAPVNILTSSLSSPVFGVHKYG